MDSPSQAVVGLCGLAFIIVYLTETGRVPVDNRSADLELSMITSDDPGVLRTTLALIEWAGMMKLLLFSGAG